MGVLCAIGLGLMLLVIRLLGLTGAPSAVVWAPWYVPTLAAVAWAVREPTPASVGDDGDESWTVFALRAALVGIDTRRPKRVRLVTALVLGGPIGWSLVIIGVLALAGIV